MQTATRKMHRNIHTWYIHRYLHHAPPTPFFCLSFYYVLFCVCKWLESESKCIFLEFELYVSLFWVGLKWIFFWWEIARAVAASNLSGHRFKAGKESRKLKFVMKCWIDWENWMLKRLLNRGLRMSCGLILACFLFGKFYFSSHFWN